MRRVPTFMNAILNLDQNAVENLIQLTLGQAKARGQPIGDLEGYHHDLRNLYREFEDSLCRAVVSGDPSPSAPSSRHLFGSWEIEGHFRRLIFLAYLLGAASPDPNSVAGAIGRKRIAKAMKIRKKGWEEPVEEAIAQAFKAASPNFPEDKDIIKMVHDEMERLGIKITVGDEALQKRIRPHRKDAERDAEFAAKYPGVEMDEDLPF